MATLAKSFNIKKGMCSYHSDKTLRHRQLEELEKQVKDPNFTIKQAEYSNIINDGNGILKFSNSRKYPQKLRKYLFSKWGIRTLSSREAINIKYKPEKASSPKKSLLHRRAKSLSKAARGLLFHTERKTIVQDRDPFSDEKEGTLDLMEIEEYELAQKRKATIPIVKTIFNPLNNY